MKTLYKARIVHVLQAESYGIFKIMEEKIDTRCSENKSGHLSIEDDVFHQMQKTFQFLSCRWVNVQALVNLSSLLNEQVY